MGLLSPEFSLAPAGSNGRNSTPTDYKFQLFYGHRPKSLIPFIKYSFFVLNKGFVIDHR